MPCILSVRFFCTCAVLCTAAHKDDRIVSRPALLLPPTVNPSDPRLQGMFSADPVPNVHASSVYRGATLVTALQRTLDHAPSVSSGTAITAAAASDAAEAAAAELRARSVAAEYKSRAATTMTIGSDIITADHQRDRRLSHSDSLSLMMEAVSEDARATVDGSDGHGRREETTAGESTAVVSEDDDAYGGSNGNDDNGDTGEDDDDEDADDFDDDVDDDDVYEPESDTRRHVVTGTVSSSTFFTDGFEVPLSIVHDTQRPRRRCARTRSKRRAARRRAASPAMTTTTTTASAAESEPHVPPFTPVCTSGNASAGECEGSGVGGSLTSARGGVPTVAVTPRVMTPPLLDSDDDDEVFHDAVGDSDLDSDGGGPNNDAVSTSVATPTTRMSGSLFSNHSSHDNVRAADAASPSMQIAPSVASHSTHFAAPSSLFKPLPSHARSVTFLRRPSARDNAGDVGGPSSGNGGDLQQQAVPQGDSTGVDDGRRPTSRRSRHSLPLRLSTLRTLPSLTHLPVR